MEFRKYKVFTENYSKIVEACTLSGAETRFWRDIPIDEDVDVIAIVDIERGRNLLTDKGQLTIPDVIVSVCDSCGKPMGDYNKETNNCCDECWLTK